MLSKLSHPYVSSLVSHAPALTPIPSTSSQVLVLSICFPFSQHQPSQSSCRPKNLILNSSPPSASILSSNNAPPTQLSWAHNLHFTCSPTTEIESSKQPSTSTGRKLSPSSPAYRACKRFSAPSKLKSTWTPTSHSASALHWTSKAAFRFKAGQRQQSR